MTFLETAFPFRDVSSLVAADRRSPDPAYQAHRWWARRPPALVRAALLAVALPADTTPSAFWRDYASPRAHLDGLLVTDPFLGGGTTLVEAARLGAEVTGTDVDPLAVMLSEHQLDSPAAADFLDAGTRLAEHLADEVGPFWPQATDDDGSVWQPLHYFSVARVTCRGCEQVGPLYRSLVIARSVGRAGRATIDHQTVAQDRS